ncbi:MAG: holo-ACP synthase [Phycisphaerae bacterium]
MDVLTIGVDLVENARVGAVLERHGERFYERVLTPAEQAAAQRLRDPLPHIAGRFAAKEAVMKVLRTGWRGGVAWTDIEVVNDAAGEPHVTLSGECSNIARRLGIGRVLISISHTERYATATALGVR